MAEGRRFSRPMLVLGCVFAIVWAIVVALSSLTKIFRIGRKAFFFVKNRSVLPDALTDPRLGEHGYLQLSKVKLHYVASGPTDGPLMLMVHGFPEFWYSWRHQIKHFNDKYRVVAIDLRGYGDSSKPLKVDDYTIDKLANDLAEFVEGMGYKKCMLLAHDWGGAVAWSFAQMHPEMVEKLVACNIPHPSALMENMESSWRQMLASWYIYFFQVPVLPELTLRAQDMAFVKRAFSSRMTACRTEAFTEEDVELYKYAFSKPGSFRGPVNYYRAMFRHGDPSVYPSAKVTVPVLMIWGVKDRALRKETAEMSRAYTEDYRIKYIDASSHWVQQEAPEEVNSYITQFIANKI